ncbi:MAG: cytochrome c [Rhodobacterales bacterium]|nr:cytochrome c [Rhodobacterales bacterium]
MNNKFLYGFGAFVVAAIAFVFLQSESQKSAQNHSMAQPDTSSVAQGDPIATVALPAGLSPNAQIGKRAFETKCAACHGENAAGQNGVAPPLVHVIYRPNHHSDMAFVRAAQNGVKSHHWSFGNMPPIEGLTDAEVKYIARYVRELQLENGIK